MRPGFRAVAAAAALLAAASAAGCGARYERVEQSLSQPVDCAAADAEIQRLESSKVGESTQTAEALSYALPTTVFVGALTGAGGAVNDVSTGEYNRKIDERIQEIRSTCATK